MKKIFHTLTTLLLVSTLAAQNKADTGMYYVYLNKEYSPDLWKTAVIIEKEVLKKNEHDQQSRFQLALAQFGLLSSTMQAKDEDFFNEYYDNTVQLLEKIIETNKKWAEPHALLSATYGLKMAYSPVHGMFLGPKSENLIEKAKKLAPSSPLVWKVFANSKYLTPEMWGGDLKEAVASYEKCTDLYEAKPELLKFNWMYLDALAFMGQAYLKTGETGKAIATYEKALKVEPEFGWVKHTLLPKAKSKAGK